MLQTESSVNAMWVWERGETEPKGRASNEVDREEEEGDVHSEERGDKGGRLKSKDKLKGEVVGGKAGKRGDRDERSARVKAGRRDRSRRQPTDSRFRAHFEKDKRPMHFRSNGLLHILKDSVALSVSASPEKRDLELDSFLTPTAIPSFLSSLPGPSNPHHRTQCLPTLS